jgi:Ca2+/Na+ antiporter
VAETLAVGGVILLVLAVTGGIEVIATKLVAKKEFIPMGDRVAAALIGGALIGLAVALQVDWHRWGLWITLGLLAAAVLWYATFLGRRL